MTKKTSISMDFGKRVADALADESDRACVILVASWVEHLLSVKFAHEYSKGSSDARDALFSANGPFATLSAKVNAAYCAGWIDGDVYHDLKLLQKLRNKLAHSIEAHSLHDAQLSSMVARLRVPKREYHDWGQLRAAALDDGVVFFTGERPAEATEDLEIGKLTFRMGASVLVAVLVANLGIPIDSDDATGQVVLELPGHMREISD